MMVVAAVVAAAMVLGTTTAAQAAVTFALDDYAVTANTGDGLIINTADLLEKPFEFTLELGTPQVVDLFAIWTPEGDVGSDDVASRDISVDFSFSVPEPAFGGVLEGSTRGHVSWTEFYQWGRVEWDNPLILSFGYLASGQLRIDLSDETFNAGSWWHLGDCGAKVQATFTLVAEPTAIPEPASVLVWGSLGLLSVVAVSARRNRARRSRA